MHHGQCEKGRYRCFSCGQIGHIQTNYPSRIDFGANKVPISMSSAPAPKGATSSTDTSQNYLYALITHQDFEVTHDVLTGILKLFSHDMHYLLDSGSTLSYVTLFVVVYLGFGPKWILDPFFISTSMGNSMVTRRFYKGCVVFVGGRKTLVEFD